MTHDSRTLIDPRHRRTIFIAALIVTGVCLFAAIAGLSLSVPLALEDEIGLIEGLHRSL
jgi:hypothetical protein